jgi:hypothetical protein
VRDLVSVVADRFEISAAALTAYDPAYDADGRMLNVAMELMGHVASMSSRVKRGI